MPCYEPRFGEVSGKTIMKDEAPAYMDKLARMLCQAMLLIEDQYVHHWALYVGDKKLRAEMEQWWSEHKEFDRKRGAR